MPRKLKYLRKARHWHGHGIHSPYLFRLITRVIEDKKQYPSYTILRVQKKRIVNRVKEISNPAEISYKGTSLKILSGKKKLLKTFELGYRYGKLLLRLVNEFKPRSVSCYGPTFGLNLLYPALADENIIINYAQTDTLFNEICRETLRIAGFTNVNFVNEEELANSIQEFVFINLPFLPDETLKIFNSKITFLGDDDVMVIRGIHKSGQMESIWNNLIKENKVRVSLDLYEIGIILFRKNLQKEHFVLRF